MNKNTGGKSRMAKEKDKVTIKIPRPLYKKLQAIIEGSGYNSVTDFIVFVLRDLIASSRTSESGWDEKDLQEIKKRLKNLGYL